jgi:hypothetical protein
MKILVSTPFRYTKRELRGRKIKKAAFASSVAAGFVVFAAAIVLFTGGVDDTLTSLKMLLGMR